MNPDLPKILPSPSQLPDLKGTSNHDLDSPGHLSGAPAGQPVEAALVGKAQVAAHLALLHPFSPCLGLHPGREQEDLVQDTLLYVLKT